MPNSMFISWQASRPLLSALRARVARLVSELQRAGVLTLLPAPSTDSGSMMTGLEFHALHREIWSVLKDEVMKGYAQASQAAAGVAS